MSDSARRGVGRLGGGGVWSLALGVIAVLAVSVASAAAQTPAAPPPPPPPVWTAAAGAGLTFTSGNTTTSTINLSYDLKYDPHIRNIVTSQGLVLRGRTSGVLSSDRVELDARDEYKIAGGASVFGQNQYVKDVFKGITYLEAPTGGVSYTFVDTKPMHFDMNAGAGGVWEQDAGVPRSASAAVTFGEKFMRALSATATVTQSLTALWKTKDFSDALYTTDVSLAVSMSTHTQLKIDVLDTFKNKPPDATIKKNDVTTIVAFVYKSS